MRSHVLGLLAPFLLVACDNDTVQTTQRWTDKAAPQHLPVPLRWFQPEHATIGSQLFQANCAECHGKNAEGAPNWRQPGPDGKYPAPPLNGTGHAWHHSLNVLQEVILSGSPGGQGNMPAGKDKLSKEEVLAIIAWFQSLWPDEIYTAWYERNRTNQRG